MTVTHQMPANVQAVFASYPSDVAEALLACRDRIFSLIDNVGIDFKEETLKWGQPSYLAKQGMTIRLGLDEKNPQEYALYFYCQTRLISSFREVYGDVFHYSGNLALVSQLGQAVLEKALNQCLLAALRYHSVKHLPTLGLV